MVDKWFDVRGPYGVQWRAIQVDRRPQRLPVIPELPKAVEKPSAAPVDDAVWRLRIDVAVWRTRWWWRLVGSVVVWRRAL